MYSSRLFFKYNRRPLKLFFKQVTCLNCGIWHPSTTSNFMSFAPVRGLKMLRVCGGTDDQITEVSDVSQITSSRKISSGVLQSTGTLQIPQRTDLKRSETAKFKDKNEGRKYTIITKSKDPDIFGDLEDFVVEDTPHGNIGEDSTFHEDFEILIPLERKYRSPNDYLKGMKDLVKEKKLKQALELFPDMKRHRVPPIHPHYTFMIGVCGRAGYTEMAFKLLRQMTDKGFKPTPATLTGLFNSCAESPNTDYGLKKAIFLKEKVRLKSWEVTVPTYRAMIKAFGKCGNIKTAFEIVDEMIESGCRVSMETYNALLIACISNKDAGFTHAIEVWRKMTSKKIRPDIYSFNLLLRAVRDCDVGPEEVSCNLLHHWSSRHTHFLSSKKEMLSREDVLTLPHSEQNIKLLSHPQFHDDGNGTVKKNTISTVSDSTAEVQSFCVDSEAVEDVAPVSMSTDNAARSHTTVLSLLLPRPLTGPKFIDLEKIRNPSDRLLLIGGVNGFLELMRKHEVAPDIKTFTMLLKIIPNSTSCENELLALMDSCQVKPDVDFFNMLIKKRNFRKDFKAAKDVLVLIAKQDLCPDIVTFGVLALGCIKKKDGIQLLHDMKSLGFCPNIEIFGALLNAANRSTIDFEYICALMKMMKKEQVRPGAHFLHMLEDIKNNAHDEIKAVEQDKESERLSFPEKSYYEFCHFYEQWLKTTDVEEQVDPWHQYKTEITHVV